MKRLLITDEPRLFKYTKAGIVLTIKGNQINLNEIPDPWEVLNYLEDQDLTKLQRWDLKEVKKEFRKDE